MSCGCNDACNSSNGITIPTGNAGKDGLFGGWAQEYGFDTDTTVNPPTSKLRLNNATPANVTQIFVDNTNIDGIDTDAFLDAFINGGNFGTIKLFKEYDSTKFWLGKVTNVIDNGTYHTINVTHIHSNSTFSASDDIVLSFTANGTPAAVYYVLTYFELATLVSTSSLLPGATYVLSDYETKHLVTGTSVLNVNSTGYTTKIEQLQLTAKSTTEFFHEAKSLEYPKDNILYDFTANTVSGQPRNGLIYWRKDNDKDIEAWYDTRNHIVARYDLDLGPITWATGQIDRGQITYQGGMLKISIKDGTAVTDVRLMVDVNHLTDAASTNNDMTFSFDIGTSTTISPNLSTVTYFESISTLSTSSIKLGYGVDDVLINYCTNVVLEEGVTAISVISSNDVKIGADSTRGIINYCDGVTLGRESTDIHLRNSDNVNFKSQASQIIMRNVTGFTGGYKVSKLLITHSDENTIGDGSTSIMLVRKSEQNIIDTDCSGITLGNGRGNSFGQKCQDIELYTGKANRFAQYCNGINLLGEKDPAWSSGPVSNYNVYSSMSYNTFGSGCSNITFDTIGGRGNTFGDECKNLAFTASGQEWRLIGCNFCRGIQNKTFQTIIHSISFVVPDSNPVVITADKWYAQILKNHASSSNKVAVAGGFTSGVSSTTDDFVVGHNSISTSTGANYRMELAPGSTGSVFLQGEYGNITEEQTRVTNAEINCRAYMWTATGYPLTMTLQNSVGKEYDSTFYLYNNNNGYEDLIP